MHRKTSKTNFIDAANRRRLEQLRFETLTEFPTLDPLIWHTCGRRLPKEALAKAKEFGLVLGMRG